MVKGSIDYVGVNQYTAYYVRDQPPNASTLPSYSSDWRAQFVCMSLPPFASKCYCLSAPNKVKKATISEVLCPQNLHHRRLWSPWDIGW